MRGDGASTNSRMAASPPARVHLHEIAGMVTVVGGVEDGRHVDAVDAEGLDVVEVGGDAGGPALEGADRGGAPQSSGAPTGGRGVRAIGRGKFGTPPRLSTSPWGRRGRWGRVTITPSPSDEAGSSRRSRNPLLVLAGNNRGRAMTRAAREREARRARRPRREVADPTDIVEEAIASGVEVLVRPEPV